MSVVGISPQLQSKNDSLPSIGWKGSVPVRMEEQKEIENENKNKTPTHKVRTKLHNPASNLLENKELPASNQWIPPT